MEEGHTLEDLGMEEYEEALCEPLHHLKNLINVIFDKVYNQIKNKELRKVVMDFCPCYTGKTIYILNCKSKVYQYWKLLYFTNLNSTYHRESMVDLKIFRMCWVATGTIDCRI